MACRCQRQQPFFPRTGDPTAGNCNPRILSTVTTHILDGPAETSYWRIICVTIGAQRPAAHSCKSCVNALAAPPPMFPAPSHPHAPSCWQLSPGCAYLMASRLSTSAPSGLSPPIRTAALQECKTPAAPFSTVRHIAATPLAEHPSSVDAGH
jgi:hypothetical protein